MAKDDPFYAMRRMGHFYISKEIAASAKGVFFEKMRNLWKEPYGEWVLGFRQ